MSDNLLLQPSTRPISLATAKEHLRVTSSTEDTLLARLIGAATGHVETWTRRALVKQTRELVLDFFPAVIEPQRSPLRSVVSIQYVDTAGVTRTLDAARYRVDAQSTPARIVPAYGETWPSTQDVPAAVVVTYVAGHLLPFTADAGTDTLTCAGHGLANGSPQRAQTIGGVLCPGLTSGTDYYVINRTADTLQLSLTSGGSAVDITGAGTPPNTLGELPDEITAALCLILGHLWMNREENQDFQLHEMPLGADRLLAPWRVVRF